MRKGQGLYSSLRRMGLLHAATLGLKLKPDCGLRMSPLVMPLVIAVCHRSPKHSKIEHQLSTASPALLQCINMQAGIDVQRVLARAQRYSGQEGPLCVLRAIVAGELDDVDVGGEHSQSGEQHTNVRNIEHHLRPCSLDAQEAELLAEMVLPSSHTIKQTYSSSIAALDQHLVKLAGTWAIMPWESLFQYAKASLAQVACAC